MPKRMRDQVVRDRDKALAIARRHQSEAELPPEADDDFVAMIKEPTEVRRKLKGTDGSHLVDGGDADFDIDAFFAEVELSDETPAGARAKGGTVPPRGRTATRQPTGSRRPGQTNHDALRGLPPIEPGLRTTPSHGGPSHAATPPVDAAPASPPGAVPSRPDAPPPVTRAATQGAPPPPRAAAPPRAPTAPGIARPGAQPPPSPGRTTGAVPALDSSGAAMGARDARTTDPRAPRPPATGAPAPVASSQMSRPNPIAPGSAAARGPVRVESMSGPFPRSASTGAVPTIPQTGAIPRLPPTTATPSAGGASRSPSDPAVIATKTPPSGVPTVQRSTPRTPATGVPVRPGPGGRPAVAPQRTPPGMTDADVNALYAKYVKAKEMVGEKIGPGEHSKLLKTINSQAPKIMAQYKAKAVDFSVVVKDNQVIIRAKPKT